MRLQWVLNFINLNCSYNTMLKFLDFLIETNIYIDTFDTDCMHIDVLYYNKSIRLVISHHLLV